MRWRLPEAEREFSQLVQRALDEGPQVVTRRGGKDVVVLSAEEFRRLGGSEPGAKRFSRSGQDPSAASLEHADVVGGAAAAPAVDGSGLARTFHELAQRWSAETEALSSVQQTVTNHAYQRIIGLGPGVAPLLLEELQREPDHWFWALSAITGENPVRPESTFDDAVAAWLDWGRTRGLID